MLSIIIAQRSPSFCADLNPVENCSTLLVRNDDEGVFVGQGSDMEKAGPFFKTQQISPRNGREILPASGSTISLTKRRSPLTVLFTY